MHTKYSLYVPHEVKNERALAKRTSRTMVLNLSYNFFFCSAKNRWSVRPLRPSKTGPVYVGMYNLYDTRLAAELCRFVVAC